MMIGIILLSLALPIGIYLVADLLLEQHRTTTQTTNKT